MKEKKQNRIYIEQELKDESSSETAKTKEKIKDESSRPPKTRKRQWREE